MGTNSKLHVQFKSRPGGRRATTARRTPTAGYQSSWEVTRAQPGASGILVNYTGGNIGASFGNGTPETRAQQFLAQIEPVLPGITKAYNGKATIDFWPGYRVDEGLVLVLEGRAVHEVRRDRAAAAGHVPLRRRAHVDRLPGLPERRRRDGRARGVGDPRRPEVRERSAKQALAVGAALHPDNEARSAKPS